MTAGSRFVDIVDTVAARGCAATTYPRRSTSPSTTSSPPTPGPARRPAPHHRETAPEDLDDRALYTLGVLIFVVAILGVDRPARVRPPDPGQEVRRQGHPVVRRLRPDRVEQQIGETEYGVKAIPLGGYVKIVGMLPPGARTCEETTYDENGETVHGPPVQHRHVHPADLRRPRGGVGARQPEDPDRLFYKLPWWKKVVVMAGGPMVNIAIAFFLFWGVFATVGHASTRSVEPVVAEVSRCIVPADEDGRAAPRRADDPRRPPPRPGSSRATSSSASTAPRSPTGTQMPGADPRQRRRRRHHRGRARRRAADAATTTRRRSRARPRSTTEKLDARSASSA